MFFCPVFYTNLETYRLSKRYIALYLQTIHISLVRKQINYTYDDIRKWLEHFRTRADGGESENGVKEKKTTTRFLNLGVRIPLLWCTDLPQNEHGKQTGIILRGGIAAVGL